jgi:crossover junction endodeoxyribonuclease RusA
MVVLNLPYPPSVNHMYINARGRRFPNAKAKAYKTAISEYVAEYRVPKFEDAKIALIVWAYPPDRRKRDISNLLKIIEDSLQDAGVFNDDFNIDFIEIKRGEIKKGGGLVVMIETMEDYSAIPDANFA